jgi:Uncharacterized protein conserved in bacteria
MSLRSLSFLVLSLATCLSGHAGNPIDYISADTVLLEDGTLYMGQISDSLFNGTGRCIYADGTVYDGEWKDGLWDGQGTVIYPDGDIYQGEFRSNIREGKGTYTYHSGARYEGEWKNDRFNGQGLLIFSDGGRYNGAWKDDMKHGYGQLFSNDGESNVGFFYNDEFLGTPLDTEINKDSTLTEELESWGFKHEESRELANLEWGFSYSIKGMLTTSMWHNASDRFLYGLTIGLNIDPPTRGIQVGGMSFVNFLKDIHLTGDYISSQFLFDAGYKFLDRYAVCGSLGMGIRTAYMNCKANSSPEMYDAYWIKYGDAYSRRGFDKLIVAYRAFFKYTIQKEKPKALLYLGYGNADGLFLGVSYYL